MAGWSEEIVWIETDDRIRHDGVVIRPTGPPTGTAVVWMHGFTGHFSEPHQIAIGRYLAERGHLFVSGNNRGHHLGASLGQWGGEPRLGGAWWELVSGLGERSHLATPDVDLETHIQDVVNVLFYEDLHDVVLVGHSYGGNVITGVADRAPERLREFVYLDAAVPTHEKASADASGRRAEMERPPPSRPSSSRSS